MDKELNSTQQNYFYEWNWNPSVVLWNFPELHVGFCLAKGKERKINYKKTSLHHLPRSDLISHLDMGDTAHIPITLRSPLDPFPR